MAAIIFDFDGTIADSFDYVSEFLAKEAGAHPLSGQRKQELRGLSMIVMAKRLGFHWWDGPRLYFKGRRRMKHSIKHLNYFAGLPEVIRKAHAEGHELFILSNNSMRNVRHFLKVHKLYENFLEIYGSIGLFSKAPALRRLLKDQKLEIKNAAYVGDEIRDVEAAHAVGVKAIAVTWGFARRSDLAALKPAAIANTPDELMKILEEL